MSGVAAAIAPRAADVICAAAVPFQFRYNCETVQ